MKHISEPIVYSYDDSDYLFMIIIKIIILNCNQRCTPVIKIYTCKQVHVHLYIQNYDWKKISHIFKYLIIINNNRDNKNRVTYKKDTILCLTVIQR